MFVGDGWRIDCVVGDGPVTHVDDGSCGRCQDDTNGIHDGVFDFKKRYLEFAKMERLLEVTNANGFEPPPRSRIKVFHFPFDKGERKVTSDNRRVAKLFEQKGRGADVVQMPVGEDNATDIFFLSLEITDVRNDVINA